MSKPSLSELYQSLTEPQTLSARALIDADTALRAASGRVVPHERDEVATALAGSAAHADLVQFLHALAPASAELARDLGRGSSAHESRGRGRHAAQGRAPRRGWQWGAVAAGVVAALSLFVARQSPQQMSPDQAPQQAQLPAAVSDQIFDGSIETSLARHDEAADRIFSAPLGG